MSGHTEHIETVANDLEEYGSSRADFHQVSDEHRKSIARKLVIARNQAHRRAEGGENLWESKKFKSHMRRKKISFFHSCGSAGVSFEEANFIWWEFVYDGVAPSKREQFV
jgi:hypothetical protein